MAPNVLVVLGHPRTSSLAGALAREYADGARAVGSHVREVRVADLDFDPDVTHPSPARQVQESDLEEVRRLLLWAQHIVFVHPTWWGTAPARLKGLLDRVLLPGFAFREEDGRFQPLLGGRTAEIITTMDTPGWVYRWIFRSPGPRALGQATLGFCGIETVRTTRFGPVHTSTPAQRRSWLGAARRLGLRLGRGPRTVAQELRRGVGTWIRALRLHFYPMSVLGYLVGAWMAAGGSVVHSAALVWGLLFVVALKSATVLTNDIFDYESDVRNSRWSPFTGGSRCLVEGRLSRTGMGAGAAGALVLAGAGATGTVSASPAPGWILGAVMGVLAILALGYTVPPLKLSHRGLGEVDVAVTHGAGVVVLGWAVQGGSLGSPLPWLVSLLIGLAVLPAIILAGIPDRSADARAGKRTLVVHLGVRRSVVVALAALAGAVAASLVAVAWSPAAPFLGGLPFLAVPHALMVGGLLLRYLERGAPEKRIDGLLAVALLFILWFVAVPTVHLA